MDKFGGTDPYKGNRAEDIVPETLPDPSNHPIDAAAALPIVPAQSELKAAMPSAAATAAKTSPSSHLLPESNGSLPPSGPQVTPPVNACQSLALSQLAREARLALQTPRQPYDMHLLQPMWKERAATATHSGTRPCPAQLHMKCMSFKPSSLPCQAGQPQPAGGTEGTWGAEIERPLQHEQHGCWLVS